MACGGRGRDRNERLEYPQLIYSSGITPGYLRTLLNRFGHVNKVPLRAILEHWQGIDLTETSLYQICLVGGFLKGDWNCDFYRFLAIACGLLADNLTDTMIYICELLTLEPEGGSAMIPLRIFINLYGYLANLNCTGYISPSMIMLKEEDEEIIEHEDRFYSSFSDVSLFETCKWSDSTISYRPKSPMEIQEMVEEEEERSILTSSIEEIKEETTTTATTMGLVVEKNGIETKPIGKVETKVERKVENKDEKKVDTKGESDTKEEKDFERSDWQTKISNKVETIDDSANANEDVEIADKKKKGEKKKEEEEKKKKEEEEEEEEFDRKDRQKDFYHLDSDQYLDDSIFDIGDLEDEWYPRMEALPSDELVDSISDICTCPKPEERISIPPTPPPCDPVEEFIKRMERDIDKDQLVRIFQIEGIGPKVSEIKITAVNIWLCECARRQNGYVGPRNIKHFLCPDLQDSNDCHN
ncbi:uncharacterized protein LOC124956568 [Vespa velutina]|uniref:uncharacterized protein LOC124956568 n=1 Tax=Vespa velutina TaxID=202808 RepID=UPI001FB394F6|nr:uncharacterized protein LOC124956568 [Vespa velutina]